jgi:hypothetical protein
MTNPATITAIFYIVRAREDDSTDPNSLFGSERIVFATEAEAEAQADEFQTDDCWGREGDQTATEVGITYYVEAMDPSSIDDNDFAFDQAVEHGFVVVDGGDEDDEITLYWVAADEQSDISGGTFAPDTDRAVAEADFTAELLDQCGTDTEREQIAAGSMVWR